MRASKSDKSRDQLPRTGLGYDVHAFVAGRPLMLGGVHIPFERGLSGHSDADVLIHAVCDALLGAAALGDIGTHFPNTSRRYKNISSLILLQRVGRLLEGRRYSILHLDVTVILDQPKILRYSRKMIGNIRRVLSLRTDQVSIKATTNEGLGFIGRGEGCAAIALATIVADRA